MNFYIGFTKLLREEILRKKRLSFGHCPKVASNPLPPLILDVPEVTFVPPILGNCDVTFRYAKNLNIYPILGLKVPQNFWNMVTLTPPPIQCPKEGKNRGKQNYLKTFGFRLDLPPPPFEHFPKKNRFFFSIFFLR